jgi:peptidyl-prolyl cis-trans isomerase D
VTPAELERRVALERELREVEWLALPLDRFLDEVEVTEADVEARYQETPERWMTPESVDLAYIDLEIDRSRKRSRYRMRTSGPSTRWR